MATTDEIRRRRRIRHLQEKRRRAAIRRRNALLVAALASAVLGAAVGAGAGGGGAGTAQAGPKLARGGVGPPPGDDLVHSTEPVPILMYHVISSAPDTAQNPELFVKPRRFRAQVSALAKRGYQAITLEQLYSAWKRGGPIPRKPVVLTFDDGYRGDYTDAMPILAARHWPGVLNLTLTSIESGELTDGMVERMLDAGWELASHTISHLDLTRMEGSDLAHEVGGSRQLLRKRFHVPVSFFCYPSGRYDDRTIRAVRQAGYLGATTTDEGLGAPDQMFRLKRIRIDGSDGVPGLERKLGQSG
jgi:peptidoglycan/xylan/chitin deacetylase (PgdA/CDA1 family)